MLFSALKSRRYRRYWFGSMGTVGASQLMIMAQGWLIFELSGSPMDLGILGAAVSGPAIVVLLFGGILADRFDRRYLLMTTSLITAALLLVQALLDYSGVVEVWHVLVLGCVIGIVTGFEWPVRQAFFAKLITRDQMMSAVSLNSILWQGSRMILPALAGVLIAASGTALVFALGALGFVVMFLTLIGMQVERQVAATGSTVNQFAEGIRFIFNHRTFVVLIPLTWVWMFFGFSFNQLMPAFADSLGTHEIGFGALMSAVGLGSAVGTVFVSSIQQHRHLGFTMLAGLLFGGVALVGFGIAVVYGTTSFAFEAALVFAFLVGVFGSVYLITSMTVLQIQVPDALRGRVMGIHIISFYLMPLGGLFMGVIASTYDDSLAVIVGAFVVLVITVVAMISQRDIRRIDGRDLSDSGPDSHQLTDSTRA